NRAAGEAGDRAADIELPELRCLGIDEPGEESADAAGQHHPARTDAVDNPALEGHQPGFEQDEDREGDLNLRLAPSELVLDRQDEERPAVLQVGDRRHAGDAENELNPARRRGAPPGWRCAERWAGHGDLRPLASPVTAGECLLRWPS